MANISETARQVLNALVDFNRQPIPHETRIRVADLFRQPIRYISQNLEKHYIDAALPLTARSRRTVKLSQELHAELAVAYKIFILEAFAHRGQSSKRLIAIAIHRAISCLSEVLYLATLEYGQYPERVWRETHLLYALAAKNSIHRLPVQDRNKTTAGGSCIGDLYKRTLLYALAAPCCLRQRENQFIYGQLLEWTNFVRLALPGVNGYNSGQFLVRIASDAPPNHLSLEKKKLSRHCRILDTQRLVDHLNEVLVSMKPQTAKDKLVGAARLSRSMLEHLIINLSGRPKRRFSRTTQGYTLKLAVGMSHAYNLAKTNTRAHSGRDVKNEVDWLAQYIPRDAISDDSENGWSDSSNLLFNLDIEGDSLASNRSDALFQGTMLEDNVQSPWALSCNQREIVVYECKTRNESAGGYCVDWVDSDAPKIKPGELIGIQSQARGKGFGIATARWVRNSPVDRLQIGMQLIAPSSFAVKVRLDDEEKISCIYNSLLVPESKFAKIPLSLIVPAHSYQKGNVLWINSGNNELRISLTQLLNATTSFSQYRIAYHSK
ncbi:MAG: hypothetical protein L3J26_00095 [Candidatus Polarisedimenticolaceae bacterium]|nr:hypothetical protein [Candidatus Polarisedimenticolaceae bacterium]